MKRSKRGFTLGEVMATVAILAILFAIGVPATMSAVENYKEMELNDTARQLFLAVQNEVSTRASAGTLELAFPDTDTVWLTETDAASSGVVDDGALDAVSGGYQFAVKFNPKTGSVIESYYTQGETTNLHADHNGLHERYISGADAFTNRKSDKVGFYDGINEAKINDKIDEVNPDAPKGIWVDLVNTQEKLTLDITIENYLTAVAKMPAEKWPDLEIYVEQLDLDGNPVPGKLWKVCDSTNNAAVWNMFSDPTNPDIDTTDKKISIVLDHIGDMGIANPAEQEKKRISFAKRVTQDYFVAETGFEAIEAAPKLDPGATIRAVGVLSPAADGVQFKPLKGSDIDNSLFSRREKKNDGGVDKDWIKINNARHLKNLNTTVSDFVVPTAPLAYVEQTEDIQWPSTVSAGTIWFEGITADKWLDTYQGNNRKISNLTAYNGLFDKVVAPAGQGTRLENIALADPYAVATDSGNGGCLAGDVIGNDEDTGAVLIKNCRIFKTAEDEEKQIYGADSPGVYGTGAAVGGLVGYGKYVHIENCFTYLRTCIGNGYTKLGGLAGVLEGSDVKNSYANSKILTTPDMCAGLVGDAASLKKSDGTWVRTKIDKSFAVGRNVRGVGQAGFCNGNAVVTNSYAAVNHTSAPAYGFAPATSSVTNCYFWSDKSPKNADTAARKTYQQMRGMSAGGSWAKLTVSQTIPDVECKGKAYPFLMIKSTDGQVAPFYGDWPDQEEELICAFEDEDTKAVDQQIPVVLMSTGKSRTFYARFFTGDSAVNKTISAELPEGGILTAADVVDSGKDASCKKVTVTAGPGKSGVSYVTLSADGTEGKVNLRVAVVVCDASIAMDMISANATIPNGDNMRNSAVLGETVAPKNLMVNSKYDMVKANYTLNIAPDWATLESALQAIRTGGSEAGIPTSVDKTLGVTKDNWTNIVDNAVKVTSDPEHVLIQPGKATAGSTTWNINKKHQGTATLEAVWKMNPNLRISGEVTTKGSGVSIYAPTISQDYKDLIVDNPATGMFPDTVTLKTVAFNDLRLVFATELADDIPQNGTYSWSVTPQDAPKPTLTGATSTPENEPKPTLTGATSSELTLTLAKAGIYTLKVTYTVPAAEGKKETVYEDELKLDVVAQKKPLQVMNGVDEIKKDTVKINKSGKPVVLNEALGRGKWYLKTSNATDQPIGEEPTFVYEKGDGYTTTKPEGESAEPLIEISRDAAGKLTVTRKVGALTKPKHINFILRSNCRDNNKAGGATDLQDVQVNLTITK